MINWDSSFSVGVNEIDEQHKTLIDLVNNLADAMKAGKGSAALGRIFGELVNYTAYHFKAEEKLMQSTGYPGYELHAAKHRGMTSKVMDLKQQYDKGTYGITFTTMEFLENWLEQHIKGTDKAYGPHMNANGVS